MKTNNENRRGNYNSGAGRDGKSFDRKGSKPIFKGKLDYNRITNQSDEHKSYRDGGTRNENTPRGEKRNYDKKWYPKEGREDSGRQEGSRRFDNNFERPKRPRFVDEQHNRPEKLSFRKAGEVKENKYVETRFDHPKSGTTFRPRKRSEDYDPNAKYSKKKQFAYRKQTIDPTKPIRLNKFLANAGVSSRREADEFIQAGVISVNGEVVSELGAKVLPTDKVMFHNQPVKIEQKIYLLLNKPKDTVTTVEDTHDRKTVMDIVCNACSERIYPVGRLDRNTTGVLLLTNDGDLATKLTHPKFEKKKIYHAVLDKDITQEDFEAILKGVDLGDYKIKADALEFVKEDNLRELGIEIHSGQNRVVRRIFDSLGYKIMRLDRVYFAGLTKKNLPRGKYRFLNEREVNMLMMGAYE
ncbi:MAG: pseudouridine synthase [Paludibacteraceae bacterium]